MDNKSLIAIEHIIIILIKLNVLTKNKTADYFYDRLEMNILLELIDELEECIDDVSDQLKNKYNEINWNLVKKYRFYDGVFGKSMKLGDAWEIAKNAYDFLYNSMLSILNNELEGYYHMECVKRHEETLKNKMKSDSIL